MVAATTKMFPSVSVTQTCQILSCDIIVANEQYVLIIIPL